MSTIIPTNKAPLPHFLNLPLPAIPFDGRPISKNSSAIPLVPSSSSSPLMFKLTLSAEQFAELLHMDAEVEEGEEGGVRVEFEPGGKGHLHLSPTSVLPLAPPRSGPPRLNKPEELYQHHQQSGLGRPPLTGLMRIPISTPAFEAHRPPPPVTVQPPTRASAPQPAQPQPVQSRAPVPSPPNDPQRQKEKQAGQRLKEKRLEEERKKKEKQMVVLDDVPAAPVAKKGRGKAKGPVKPATDRAKSKASASKVASVQPPAPLPARRALPGSQTGKQLASEQNQLHSSASTPTMANSSIPNPLVNSSVPPSATLPTHSPVRAPSPLPPASLTAAVVSPPTTYKKSSSNKKGATRKTSPPVIPPDDPGPSQHADKVSASTVLSSLSEESEPDPSRTNVRLSHVGQQPADPTESTSQPSPLILDPAPGRKSLGKTKSMSDGIAKPTPLPIEPAASTPIPPASECAPRSPLPLPPNVSNTLPVAPLPKKKIVKKVAGSGAPSAKRVIKSSATVHSDDDDDETSANEPRIRTDAVKRRPQSPPNTAVKKRRPRDESTSRPEEPERPMKVARTQTGFDGTRRAEPAVASHISKSQTSDWDDPRRKPSAAPSAVKSSVTVKKIPVPIEQARSPEHRPPSAHHEETKKKRSLESMTESATTTTNTGSVSTEIDQPEQKRVKARPVLPTIRKMKADEGRPTANGTAGHDSSAHAAGAAPAVKKKKKKRPVDYTSSEDEGSAIVTRPVNGMNGTNSLARAPKPQTESTSRSNSELLTKPRAPAEPALPSFKRQSHPQSRHNEARDVRSSQNENRDGRSRRDEGRDTRPHPDEDRDTRPRPTDDRDGRSQDHSRRANIQSGSRSLVPSRISSQQNLPAPTNQPRTEADRPPPHFRRIAAEPAQSRATPPATQSRSPFSSSEDEQEEINCQSSYKRARLIHWRLLEHYGFVASRLEQVKTSGMKRVGLGYEEVQALVEEADGLEQELERRKMALERYGARVVSSQTGGSARGSYRANGSTTTGTNLR